MKLWYQLLSSETGMSNFIATVQTLVDRALSPGTACEIHGTRNGAMGDQYRLFFNYDQRELIDNGLRVRKDGTYSAFVIANSLDPALVELREMLDIPVVSFMEVCCFTACTMGESFGLVAPNRKMIPSYRDIPIAYGLRDRLASCEAIQFDDLGKLDQCFVDPKAGDIQQDQVLEAARRCIAKGAEVVFAAGPPGALMAQRGIFQIDGVPLLDTYTLLAKSAEMMATMHKLTGVCVSRMLRYQAPPKDLVQKVAAAHNVDILRDG